MLKVAFANENHQTVFGKVQQVKAKTEQKHTHQESVSKRDYKIKATFFHSEVSRLQCAVCKGPEKHQSPCLELLANEIVHESEQATLHIPITVRSHMRTCTDV